MKLSFIVSFICVLAAITPAAAATYVVDSAQSEVSFGGTHAGNPFTGRFETWTATIDFDAAAPQTSKLAATFDLVSAKTGNSMYDGTLPQADWFDIKNTPQANFTSTAVSTAGDNKFTVTGDLTLRGITKPVTFDFTLTEGADGLSEATATIPVDRLMFDIGRKSDAKAEWVSKNIDITLKIKAKKS